MPARILVVDDEAMLRRLMVRALIEAGYLVQEASDGRSGLDLARAAPIPFDLVITDSRLPGLSGPDLVKQLREVDPSLPIINVSGSHGERTASYTVLPSNVPTLFKPFELSELVRLTGELLAEA
ncbi:MAG TPA: response regulator [Gemmatimonadales bacterium]|nr:response regulator [Gemmatimonadales bacterium]